MANISIKKDFQDGEELFAEQLNLNFATIEAGVNTANKIVWQGENGEEVVAFRGTTEEINSRNIIDGQTLYNVETGETYLDVGSERISTGAGNVVAISEEQPTNEATKIWINPDEIVKSEVGFPIKNEYGEHSDATYSCNYINTLKESLALKELWKNTNPSAAFNAQNINLSSSDYDYLIFVYKFYNTYTQNMGHHDSVFVPKGYGCSLDDVGNYGIDGNYDNVATYKRPVERISDTQFSVKPCGICVSVSPFFTEENTYLIPLFIYGVKWK